MIKYHIISLLCLAIAAITAIEALARFMEPSGMANPLGWMMVAVSLASVLLYFRTRKLRKKAGGF